MAGRAADQTADQRQRNPGMTQSKAEAIVARLLSNAAGLKFGSVSASVKIHSGRVVDVTYTTTESMRETETAETEKPVEGDAT